MLAILYIYLKKNGGMCCKMEGAAEEEAELEELLPETEGLEGTTNVDGSNPAAPAPAPTDAGDGNTGDVPAPAAEEVTDVAAGAEESVQPCEEPSTNAGVVAEPEFVSEMPEEPPLEEVANEDAEAIQQVDFIESEEQEPVAIAGKVLVQFTYMPAANKVNLTLIRIGDLPPVERGGSETVQAHLCVLPMRKQRFRTKAVPVSKGVFNETFQFIHMTKDLVESCAIRLRIYGTQRFSKRLIGEVKMPLSKLDLTSPLADEQIWKNLSPKGLVAYWYGIDEEDEPDDDDW